MEYIYIVSRQSGQKARRIFLITNNYERAFNLFYKKELSFSNRKVDTDTFFCYDLHKVPFDVEIDQSLGLKFKTKFKNWKDVNDELVKIKVQKRDDKIEKFLNKK